MAGLFSQRDVSPHLKEHYITLLEKFEVALRISRHQMIIPSLMCEQATYPNPDSLLQHQLKSESTSVKSDSTAVPDLDHGLWEEVESWYQPTLHRFWLADFVPDGFWPRLICRVATDQQIAKV